MNFFRLHNALNAVWALEQGSANAELPRLASAIKNGEFVAVDKDRKDSSRELLNLNSNSYVVSDYGQMSPPEMAPKNSVAILDIFGTITKMDQFCGTSGTVTKSNLIQRCDANPNIKAMILNIRSGGGEALAALQMNDFLKSVNKPIVAFVDDMAASAAYFIASACDSIICNASYARVGSIGTYLTIADFSGYFEQMGVKVMDIYASNSTEKNLPYRNAISGDTKMLVSEIDRINQEFMDAVASNRAEALSAAKTDPEVWNHGAVFYADQALKLGLIDGIATLDDTINSLL